MNKRIDFSNLGGFPLEQDTLDFMQSSYRSALSAIANLCGNKVILTGVEVFGSTVSDGWIAYNGDLIPFVGGAVAASVIIVETPADFPSTFEDGNERDVYFTKVATCGIGGSFPFTDLIRLTALQNVWLPGDIKEKIATEDYISANFDADGYGLNREIGWRILAKAYPESAGTVSINRNPSDTIFNECGKTGGEKEHTQTILEMPNHGHKLLVDSQGDSGGVPYSLVIPGVGLTGSLRNRTLRNTNGSGELLVEKTGGGQPFNVLNPYFVTLKLVKL